MEMGENFSHETISSEYEALKYEKKTVSTDHKAAKFRHELKYEISYGEYLLTAARLSTVMRPDKHAGETGRYRISSLYFDNFYDKALREKLSGVRVRDKYRIRYYNNDLSYITLEKKSKRNSLCLKRSCRITRKECRKILNGDIEWMAAERDERILLAELYTMETVGLMRPKTIITYDRQPLVYKPGNVRITFDSNIRTGLYHTDIFDSAYPLIEVLPGGRMIMEVKYDEYLPDIIRALLQSGLPRVGAFSKYASGRKYE